MDGTADLFWTPRRKGVLLLVLATACWSSAGLFARGIPVDAWTMQFWRAASGAAFLLATLVVQFGWRAPGRVLRLDRASLLAIPCSALSMIGYITALHLTSVAEVMVVYATQPFVTAAMAWLFLREPMGRRTALAAAIALAGICVTIVGGELGTPGSHRLLGDLVAFLMVIGFAAIFVVARGKPGEAIVSVNILAATLSALICLPLASPLAASWPSLALLVIFGFLTLGLGLTLLSAGARLIPAGEAALLTLLDVPLGPFWVWLAFGETPGLATVAGGTIVMGAVLWQMRGDEVVPRIAPKSA